MKKIFLLMGLLAVVAAVVGAQSREITGFRVPDYDEKNNLKSELSGEKARYGDNNEVIITKLKIESYSDDEVDMTITSPECTYDRANKTAKSKSRIRIDRENMIITGEDFVYDSEKKVFIINKDVKVVLLGKSGDKPLM